MIRRTSIDQIPGVELRPYSVFSDSRGGFAKPLVFSSGDLSEELSICYSTNESKGTVRGFHLQLYPKVELKYVVCIRGSIFDVIIDLRRNSPTFLATSNVILNEDSPQILTIPPGVAHGYQSLQDETFLLYGILGEYSKEYSTKINPLDPELEIQWPLEVSSISLEDRLAQDMTSFLS